MSDPHSDAIGLWQLAETQAIDDDGSGRVTNNHYTFAYEGETVIVWLLTMKAGMWKSPDDFYRLDARWDGVMLTYRPPFGDWTELAAWVGDHFEDTGSGTRRVFRRITEDEVIDFNRAILAPRDRHDYSIAATDPPS